MKKLLAALYFFILFSSLDAAAQQPPLDHKQWCGIGQSTEDPDYGCRFGGSDWFGYMQGLVNPSNKVCIAEADANCSQYVVPGAGGIWEVRVRDGDGATLSDVVQVTGTGGVTLNQYALVTDSIQRVYDPAGAADYIVQFGLDTQADNVVNTSNSAIVSAFGYGFDGTTWDRVRSTTSAASLATTDIGWLSISSTYFNDLTNGNLHRWDGDVMNSEAIANTNTAPFAQTFNFGYDPDNTTWRWLHVVNSFADDMATTNNGLVVAAPVYGFDGTNLDRIYALTHADNISTSSTGLVTVSAMYAYDGAALDMLRVGASGELQVTDVATRAGEDAGNDWRKIKKEETAVYNPAVTAGTAVDETEDVVCASTYVLNLPNWSVWVKNAGGGSADALTDVDVEGSYDNSTWVSLTSTACDTLASGAAGRCYAASNESIAYIRVSATCGAGDHTTVDCVIQGNKN